ncbi:MAG: hypothetical protein V3T58_06355 [Candidatus Hydrothermarchaeales archaeon]
MNSPTEGAFVKVTITDPDVAVRIDGVEVKKIGYLDNKVAESWRLEDYRSTEEINLEVGAFYLTLLPYWRRIDPLPVWFRLENTGTTQLLVESVLTEGGTAFKNVATLKSGRGINIAGCYKIEYRCAVFSLVELSVVYIDGVREKRKESLASAGIRRIGDLVGKEALELSKVVGISTLKLAELIRKAEMACAVEVSRSNYESIGDERIVNLLNTPVSTLVRKTGRTKEEIEELMDKLGDLTVAIDTKYLKRLSLEDLFKWD